MKKGMRQVRKWSKADMFDLSVCGKFNRLNRRIRSKDRRNEAKKEITAGGD